MRKKANKKRITPAAIDAWKRGDVMGCHEALDLAPFEYSPVPCKFGGYGLPDEPRDSGLIIDQGWGEKALGWHGVKELQDELRRTAGEPGVER